MIVGETLPKPAFNSPDRVLELLHPRAERATDLREPLRTEQEQRQQKQEDDLPRADVGHAFRVAVCDGRVGSDRLEDVEDRDVAPVPVAVRSLVELGRLIVPFVGLAALLPLFTKIAIATSRKATAVSVILVCRTLNELMRRGREFVDIFVSPLSISLL